MYISICDTYDPNPNKVFIANGISKALDTRISPLNETVRKFVKSAT